MIHPEYWSLRSIYYKLRYGNEVNGPMNPSDAKIYLEYLKPKGKIMLDDGAYKGDSAELFLRAGAKKRLCES